jgi:hypothetical protein
MNENFIVLNDPGASTNKGCGSYGGKPQFVSMSPYCAKDEFGEGDRLAKEWGHSEVALESSWVSDPDGTYLLGQGAKSYHGSALGTEELKYKKALYKTLAMVGYFAQVFSVPNKAKISIGVLLPFNEYRRSQEDFGRDLRVAIENFTYCGKSMSFELVILLVRPEGSGIFMGGLSSDVARDGSLLIITMGFRNTSGLFHDSGMLNPANSSTSDFGYRWLVTKVAQQAGYKDEEWILEQIFSADGDRDVKAFASAATPMYWNQLRAWLDSLPKAKRIVFSGGTALTLEETIKNEITNNIWPQKLHDKVIRYESDPFRAFLFMDLYGVYLATLSAIKKVGI